LQSILVLEPSYILVDYSATSVPEGSTGADMDVEPLDHMVVLNFAAKNLARASQDCAPSYSEPWRFPLIDSYRGPVGAPADSRHNAVTFVWHAAAPQDKARIAVVGTFGPLWDATPLEVVRFGGNATRFRALKICVPKGQVHTYKFLVEGRPTLDPINPQRTVLDNGVEWSRFFTQECSLPLCFEDWELALLMRLTNEILPFTSPDAQDFLNLYYFTASEPARSAALPQAYRLEQAIGAVNFIDKFVAREETHRLVDYKLCLRQLRNVLAQRFPNQPPQLATKDAVQALYNEMAADSVTGWDTTAYAGPNFFLQLLRRHTYMGAFSHPKYGGNAAAAGWAFLEDSYRGPDKASCFNWRRAVEPPWGFSADYHG
jgi:hypothetical protein